MVAGQAITGEYQGIPFSGTVDHVEPNWEHGSRGAVNVYVSGDNLPMRKPGETLALLGVNPSTGRVWDRKHMAFEPFKITEVR
jgi:hypothetical protein